MGSFHPLVRMFSADSLLAEVFATHDSNQLTLTPSQCIRRHGTEAVGKAFSLSSELSWEGKLNAFKSSRVTEKKKAKSYWEGAAGRP